MKARYRFMQVDNVEVFYCEARQNDVQVILFLPGVPTASQTFRDLIPLLSDRNACARDSHFDIHIPQVNRCE